MREASIEDDRRHILNSIAGRGLDEEPLAEHPSWRQAVERDIVEARGGDELWRALLLRMAMALQLPQILAAAQRDELNLDFTGSVALQDRSAAPLAQGLASAGASALRRLEVSCRWCPEISDSAEIGRENLTELFLDFADGSGLADGSLKATSLGTDSHQRM
eukprot:Skav216910  [mRNA]  locus=scaffold685:298676:306379:- [translate_table: standard]